MTNPVSKVYGDVYGQEAQGRDSLGKPQTSRAAKTRRYGFNVPASVENEVGEEGLSLAVLGSGFCAQTSAHGVSHVSRASSPGKRLCWAILTLLSFGALIYHLSELIIKYTKFETSTSITYNNSIRRLDFPAVTVCNNNMIRTSKINNHLQDLISSAKGQTDRFKAKEDIIDTLAYEYALLQDEELKYSLGHQFENLTLSSEFSYEDMSENFVHLFNPYHGNCYTFNHFSIENRTTTARAGAEYGLKLMLNLEQYEYVPFLTEASGVKILVHDPFEMPFPEDGGITVAPNTLTRLAVKKSEFKRINGRYGDCLLEGKDELPDTIYQFEHGYKYSKRACQKSCAQAQIILKCECFTPQIPYNDTFFGYDSEEPLVPCATDGVCVDEVEYNFTLGLLKCSECKNPCLENAFDITPSSTTWPAPTYMGDLKNEISSERPRLQAVFKEKYELHNTINVAIQENLLQVVIFYDKISFVQIIEEPKVSDFQFISDLGGSLGLWIGFSMLTIFEFFELGVDLLVLAFVKYKTNKGERRTHPSRVTVKESTLHNNSSYSR